MEHVANYAEIVKKDIAGEITVNELLKLLVNEYGDRIGDLKSIIARLRYYEDIAKMTHPQELIDENIALKKRVEELEKENRCLEETRTPF